MAADDAGNDLQAVGVPVTGFVAFAPYGTALPTPEQGKAKGKGYKWTGGTKLGLLTEDGGPEWSFESDGDAIELWQEGYEIPSGKANVTCKIKLAQTDPTTVAFIRGASYDEHSHMLVDGGGNSKRYAVIIEEVFKNGTIRRRAGAAVTIQEVAEDKSERGSVLGYEVTLKFAPDQAHPGHHFAEWLLPFGSEITPKD